MRDNAATYITLLLVALGIAILVARTYSGKLKLERSRLDAARTTISNLSSENSELKKTHAATIAIKEKEIDHQKYLVEGLTKIIDQRKSQFPWLASAYADFRTLIFEKEAKRLEHKAHPAVKSAEIVREYAKKHHKAVRELRTASYRVEYYEKLFPWMADYVGDDVPDYAVDVSGQADTDDEDRARFWLSKAEYERLPTAVRYQRALDNWKRRKKSNWEIGRDYERFVGYGYESQGYDVQFTGAIDGFEDMGRDLIAEKAQELLVIQCKYWSEEKEIHEKHIFQLFASSLEYAYRLGGLVREDQYSFANAKDSARKIKPVLYTSTAVSEVAREVAKVLDVTIHEKIKISDYPMIKCNLSMRDGQRIYHLPFDQQYDRVKIKYPGERYVSAIAEAEILGFRRAWKWRPDNT